jgi:LemA protein
MVKTRFVNVNSAHAPRAVRLPEAKPFERYPQASSLRAAISRNRKPWSVSRLQEFSTMFASTRFKHPFAILLALFLAVPVAGCGVNNIPTYEQSAKSSWSEVLNQYKRRTDLIDNLVNTVKGFAEQEKSVLTQVTEARAKATSIELPADILTNPEAMKKFTEAQNTLGGALRQLMVVAERYPDIKSGQNFLTLQAQLEGTENRIATARRDYIQAVKQYNTEISTYPGKWWKSFLYPDKAEMANFDLPAEEMKAPKVDFDQKK